MRALASKGLLQRVRYRHGRQAKHLYAQVPGDHSGVTETRRDRDATVDGGKDGWEDWSRMRTLDRITNADSDSASSASSRSSAARRQGAMGEQAPRAAQWGVR